MSSLAPSPRFVYGLQATLADWHNKTCQLDDGAITCLNPDFPNLLRVVEMGIVLPQTRAAAAALMEQCFFWVEGAGHAHTWVPVLQRLIPLLPPENTVLHFRLLKQQAQFVRQQHHLAEALLILVQAEQLAQQLDSPSALADVYANQAAIYHLQRNYPAAEKAGAAALALCGAEDKLIRAAAFVTLGHLAQEQGHLSQAEQLLHQAIPLCRQLGTTLNTVRALKILSLINHAQKKYPEALHHLAEAEAILSGTPHHKDLIELLQNRGAIYHECHHLDLAEITFRQAEQLLQPLPGLWRNKGMIATCLGCVYRDQRQAVLAENAFQQGITFYRQAGDNLLLANGWGNLAKLWQQQERLTEAHHYFRQAITLLEQFPHHQWAKELKKDYENRAAALLQPQSDSL
ncbi:MAG: tetratricopeptide repeat protein [Chloroflexi bacterium]|nr:tetratricopeptide repeat protein [Chloroflexota bacterium]MBP8055732.1 tetratricopeptide repeat protein [Chloroflexota bacterium]